MEHNAQSRFPRTNGYPSVSVGAEILHGGPRVVPKSRRPSLNQAESPVVSRVPGRSVSWSSPSPTFSRACHGSLCTRLPTSSPTISCRLVSTFVLCGSTHGPPLAHRRTCGHYPNYREVLSWAPWTIADTAMAPFLAYTRAYHDATSRAYRWGVARFLESGHLCQCHGVGGAPELEASPPSSSATSSEVRIF